MKKFNFIVSVLLLTVLPLVAIPGVEDVLPTESGQYVYYRDYSFRVETYIGFLQYDEGTYSIRYYSPNPEIGSNEIELLITVDPTKDYILMTGERIVSSLTADDTDTLNYMHDIFYELSSRRKKINEHVLTDTDTNAYPQANNLKNIGGRLSIDEDYPQYGGTVQLNYNLTIPIFNLESIYSVATITDTNAEIREMLLRAVTMGQLIDSTDQSFSNFTGIPDVPAIIVTNEKLTEAQIDESWILVQDDAWILNSDAFLRTYEIEIDQARFKNLNYTDLEYFSRKFAFTYPPDILNLSSLSIFMDNNSVVIENLVYIPDTQRYTCVTTIITPLPSQYGQANLYTITSISAYYNYYYNNLEYFQSKINIITEYSPQ